jgi:hypothetical protein
LLCTTSSAFVLVRSYIRRSFIVRSTPLRSNAALQLQTPSATTAALQQPTHCATADLQRKLTTMCRSLYMQTAILPVRYEITNTGATGSASSMKQVCSSVISEGGYEATSIDHVARRTTILATISTTFLPLVSIRLASTALGAVVLPNRVQVLPTTSQNYEVALFKNATLTGASWTATASDANVEYDVSATATTGGTIVQTDYVTSTSQAKSNVAFPTGYNFDLQLGVSLAGVSDIYTVGIRTVSGATTGDAVGSLSFYDLTQ